MTGARPAAGSSYDAIVVGAGHQGLVAAITLAEAGWAVLVLESAERAGGALKSGELTRPGYVHDLFATNLNLFLASAFYAEHEGDLARLGFAPARSNRPFASAFPDGSWLGVSTDLDETLSGLARLDEADAAGWRELHAMFVRYAPTLFSLYGSPAVSLAAARALAHGVHQLGIDGSAELARLLVSSCRELVDEHLASDRAKALIAPWGLHLDFGPDVAGGAVFPFLEAFADQSAGMSVALGGASRLVDALCGRLAELGGELRASSRVSRILVSGGRSSGVELDSGERLAARRAVLASVTPHGLLRLLDGKGLTDRHRGALRRYRYGPATMMIHLACSGPLPWAGGEQLGSHAYVHIAPYLDDLARTYADSLAGRLPLEPLLVVGQTSVVDPTRAPGNAAVVWIQVRSLPRHIDEDPAGGLAGRSWDDAADAYADRVLAKLERYAPGALARIEQRAVLSPGDLERHDANLVGGDSLAGSMHLRQNFFFRPAPGLSGYRTPIEGLWLIGAATWPGAGLNAVSGREAARALLSPFSRARPALRAGRHALAPRSSAR